jgi:hypothetical protein
MSRLTRLCRALGVGIAVTTATLAMTQVANAQLPPPKIQPEAAAIQAPPANVVFLVGHVLKDPKNVQTYKCIGGKLAAGSVPTAELVDDNKNVIVHHSEGPTWTATDGSSVKGTPVPNAKVTIDPTAVPWLLLSTVDQKTGGKTLNDTTFIQRVNTTGGVNPTPGGACTQDLPVPYTADYYFYKAAGKSNPPVTPGA